jgi:hypothetical protein
MPPSTGLTRNLSAEQQVGHLVPEALTPRFVLGQRPPFRLGTGAARGRQVFEFIGLLHHFQHEFRVGFPIRRQVQNAARSHLAGEQRHERLLNDAPLVVPFFWPGVGKIDAHAVQARVFDPVLQYLDRVVAGDADVFQAVLLDLEQQPPDTRLVDFHAEEVLVGMGLRHLPCRFAVAEADLHDDRVFIAEQRGKIQRCAACLHTETGPEFLQRPLLSLGHPAGAQNVGTDRAVNPSLRGVVSSCRGSAIHRPCIVTSVT